MTDLILLSAPDIPDTVVWYEFLLDNERLKTHLSSPDPDPTGPELIKKFFEQANKPINDQGQILPPPENQKNLSLKCLALQTAAFLKWDLNIFEKELPISCRHQLLRELLAFCNAPSFPSRALDIKSQIKTMHDHTIMAIVLYCRWAARTVVKSAFPVKPSGRITPTAPAAGLYQTNAQQRYEELKEQIVGIVKDQCFDIVQTLESFLQQIKRAVFVPDFDTIKNKELCSSDETKGWLVSLEELHAQVCYDLGCLHFMHGFYDKAHEMFGHVKEWLKCFPVKTSGYCDIENETLAGYLIACASLNPRQDKLILENVNESSVYARVMKCLEKKTSSDIRDLGEVLMDDIKLNELSMSFRDQVEQDILYNNQKSSNIDLYFDVIWSNAVCRAVRGYPQPSCLWTYELNVAQLQKILGFVQQSYSYVARKGRKKLGAFLHSLHNNLFKETLRQQLIQCEITSLCLSAKELHDIGQREKGRDNIVVQDSPTSPDIASSGPVLTTELENQLVTSFDPEFLKQTLTKLHKISPESQSWKICQRWNIVTDYDSVLKAISVSVSRDLMYILLSKVNQCFTDVDSYPTARRLLSYIRDNGKSLSFKLHKIAMNELLRIELLELINDPSLKFSSEKECQDLREQLVDVLKKARQHLMTRSSDIVSSSKELIDLNITLLLNLEDTSFFESIPTQSASGHLRFVKLLSKTLSKVSSSEAPHNEAKRSATDLWNAFADMFAASTYHQRRSQDNTVVIAKLNDVPNSLMSRPAFLSLMKKIKNPTILKIVLSSLVRLHQICQEDILADIKVPLPDLWPSSLGKQHSLSAPCLANAVREVLTHCLSLQPHDPQWLRAQADIEFAYHNFPSAFRYYLKVVAVQSNFFNKEISNPGILDNQMVRKMVKCSMQMKCNTQAAVLCQLMKDTDYSTAFKALQESRERADAMEVHYREHFWDVELLEHATCMHRDSGEVAKKESVLRALANPDINVCNTPKVLKEVRNAKSQRFFRSLARQFFVC